MCREFIAVLCPNLVERIPGPTHILLPLCYGFQAMQPDDHCSEHSSTQCATASGSRTLTGIRIPVPHVRSSLLGLMVLMQMCISFFLSLLLFF